MLGSAAMPVTPNANKTDDDILSHQRSHSVSGLQSNESPSHQIKADKSPYNLSSGGNSNPTDMQLKYENDRLKLALAQRWVFILRNI